MGSFWDSVKPGQARQLEREQFMDMTERCLTKREVRNGEIRAMARVRVRARFSTKAMTRVTARQSREEAAFRYDGKILYQKRGKKRGN